MRRRSHRPSLLSGLALFAFVAFAGTARAQEASIIGQVTDASGAVLPGVTVTATSPALQVQQVTDVTNERGEYRLTPLPIGTYTVDYMLAGFVSVRHQDLRLTAGFTAKVDVSLAIGGVAETLTVSGAAPVVDVKATAARTQLTRETLEVLPTSRSGLIAVMAQAPGVVSNLDIGGNTTGTNPSFRAFGQSGESWTTIEGIATTSVRSALDGSGNQFDYASFEETTVQTVGHSAEAPNRGIQLGVIVKSGGNDFHGNGFWSQTSNRLQSNNLDAALRAQGVNSGTPVEARWDRSAELGGRVIRNKLWFYTSVRGRRENDGIVGTFRPDGSRAADETLQTFYTLKATYQMNPSNRIIGFHQYQYRNNLTGITQFTSWDARVRAIYGLHHAKLEWNGTRGNTFVSAQQGYRRYRIDRGLPGSELFTDQVATVDQITSRVTGMNTNAQTLNFEGRSQTTATVTHYRPNALWGNHELKGGVDYHKSYGDRSTSDRGAAKNYQLIFRNGVPFQLAAYNNPIKPANVIYYVGAYGQDSWTMARRLTLNLGVRYSYNDGFLPEQCRPTAPAPLDTLYAAQCYAKIQFKTFSAFVPRLHAAYDVTGNGKTVIKGGWGRFSSMRQVDEMGIANLNTHLQTAFRWHDNNNNNLFEPGEVNFDREGPDFVSTTVFVGGAQSGAVPNPNERPPRTDQFDASLERQVLPNLAIRATGIYSKDHDTYRIQNNLRPYGAYNIPITNRDPGPDGRVGTADDPGTTVTYYDYAASLAGQKFQQPMLINDSASDASFTSFEVAASRRLANRWQFMASYSTTKRHIPYVPSTAGGLGLLLTDFNPNAEIHAGDNTREWLERASGSYLFPADVLVSANFERRSGEPDARTVSFTGGQQIPSITLRVEPLGSIRRPNLDILNLRTEKSFRLRSQHRISLRLNVYNVLNVNSVTNWTLLSGPNYLKPTALVPPRIAELGATYDF